MKAFLACIFLLSMVSAFAADKGRSKVEFGTYHYGKGSMVTITGKSAKALFKSLKFKDIQSNDVTLKNGEKELIIKQTDTLQCKKNGKKKYECTIFVRDDAVVGEQPRLYLGN